MKYIDEFRNAGLIKTIKNKIFSIYSEDKLNFMEVCGGHTHAICKFGIRDLIPEGINLISGPGCPVCVTENSYIDKAIDLARRREVIIATFGDMVKVPGSQASLETSGLNSKSVRVCYSSMDALELAAENQDHEVVFLGIGFETTAPTIAATILAAKERGINNFSVLAGNKTMPAAMQSLLEAEDVSIDGFICPGHVSTITGTGIYDFIPEDYNVACVVAGFEPIDIMETIYLLIEQIKSDSPKVKNQYKRSVKPQGNTKALKILDEVFVGCDAIWRGLGNIPGSGLKIRKKYRMFDTEQKFDIQVSSSERHQGCICGAIMRGVKKPPECQLFGTECIPESPIGPCMVSAEGACAAYFKYKQ
ncbi:MAG: hydrogenase formation protein HypD [Candidatus Marinimicrobia bacterium]|nr:hydrogenase formation protein HypD [Candidatus Neomarinimicrobiota bacterium]